MTTAIRARAVPLALVMALTACGSAGAVAGAPAPAAPDPVRAPSAELAPYYSQRPAWTPCGEAAECADVEVPLDHDDPSGERVTLAVKRIPAADPGARIGSLLVGFGGPGAPGAELVEGFTTGMASPALRAAYDVVGFDRRGVGRSSAVECVDDAALDELRAAHYEPDDAGVARYAADAADFAAACAAGTGPLLGEVDTRSAARDLDVLRAVLGDDRLHYLGYSYGTLLGATYAELFPERTGRLVLDGAMDPTVGHGEIVRTAAAGLERALRTYADACLSGPGCPLTGDTDTAVAQVAALLERAASAPLPAEDGRELTPMLAASGIWLALYDDELWPVLTDALTRALTADDGTLLLLLADAMAGRQPDGSYVGNVQEAQVAITCLDLPMDAAPADVVAASAELAEVSPTFGALLAFHEVRCLGWPHAATGSRAPVHARGAAPILVVGSTGDPVTPHSRAQALAGQLASGRLLTWVGEGHTAYGRADDCLHDAVDAYLVDGTLPPEGTTC